MCPSSRTIKNLLRSIYRQCFFNSQQSSWRSCQDGPGLLTYLQDGDAVKFSAQLGCGHESSSMYTTNKLLSLCATMKQLGTRFQCQNSKRSVQVRLCCSTNQISLKFLTSWIAWFCWPDCTLFRQCFLLLSSYSIIIHSCDAQVLQLPHDHTSITPVYCLVSQALQYPQMRSLLLPRMCLDASS